MYRLFTALLLALGCAAIAATPQLTLEPPIGPSGSMVTLTMTLAGNTSPGATPEKVYRFVTTVTYYDTGASDPLALVTGPVLTTDWIVPAVSGGTAFPLKNPTWTLSIPPAWAWVTDPVMTGGKGMTYMKTAGGIQATTTVLDPDTTWRTVWTMKVP